MANMSYCRFQNTYNDLMDCMHHINDPGENEFDEEFRLKLRDFLESRQDY